MAANVFRRHQAKAEALWSFRKTWEHPESFQMIEGWSTLARRSRVDHLLNKEFVDCLNRAGRGRYLRKIFINDKVGFLIVGFLIVLFHGSSSLYNWKSLFTSTTNKRPIQTNIRKSRKNYVDMQMEILGLMRKNGVSFSQDFMNNVSFERFINPPMHSY